MAYRQRVIHERSALTRLTTVASLLAVGVAVSLVTAPAAPATTVSGAPTPLTTTLSSGQGASYRGATDPTSAATSGLTAGPAVSGSDQPSATRVMLKDAPATAAQQPGASLLGATTTSGAPALDGLGGRIVDPGSAKLVGVTWRGTGPDRVELRSRDRKGTWTPWTVAEDAGRTAQAPATKEGGTEPVWVGDATGVEVRASRAGADVSTELTLTLVTSPHTAGDAAYATVTTAGPANLTAASPPVRMYRRAEWGADETWRAQDAPTYSDQLRAVVVHHTASTNSYAPEDVPAQIRSFYYYHTKVQGWRDIGYNALVDKWGRLWEGRHGGADLNVMGAQVLGFNWQTVGISMIGTHASVAPSAEELETVAQWTAWRLRLAAITDAKGTTSLTSRDNGTRWPAGTVVTVPRILGHRDLNYTDCPGNAGWAALPGVRNRVAALLAALPPGPGVGVSLTAGSPRRTSADGAYVVSMRPDGALAVTTAAGAPVWSSVATGAGGRMTIDPSGRMLLVNANGVAVWSSGTISPGAFLRLLDDGNLVLSAADGEILWDSGTLTSTPGVTVAELPRITSLPPGASVPSADGSHRLYMQGDGNLVLYRVSPWKAVWWSNTFVPGSMLIKTDGGPMALQRPNGDPVWVVPVKTTPGSLLTVQDDGVLSLSSVTQGVVWDSTGIIDNSAETYPGISAIWSMATNTVRTSPNGVYRLILQGDGNLVVYSNTDAVRWASMTFGSGMHLHTQWPDGNLVLYRGDGKPVWATMTSTPGSWLQLQDDGNLVMYSPEVRPVWDSLGYVGRSPVRL